MKSIGQGILTLKAFELGLLKGKSEARESAVNIENIKELKALINGYVEQKTALTEQEIKKELEKCGFVDDVNIQKIRIEHPWRPFSEHNALKESMEKSLQEGSLSLNKTGLNIIQVDFNKIGALFYAAFYDDENNNLYYFNRQNNTKILIDKKNYFNLTTATLNPSNDKIAYLSSDFDLFSAKMINSNNIYVPNFNIYNLKTKENTKINIKLPESRYSEEIFPVISWTSKNIINFQTRQDNYKAMDKFLFRSAIKDNLEIILNDKIATISTSSTVRLPFRFGVLNSMYSYHYENYEDSFKNKKAITGGDCIVGYINITKNNKSIIHFANNPGLFHFSKDCFWNPHFVTDGKEVVVNSSRGVYLINIDNKKMGKVANGTYSYLLK